MISAFRFKYLGKISTKKHNRLHKYKKNIYICQKRTKNFSDTPAFSQYLSPDSMNNNITIYDLAKELSTTASTVSRAFQDHPRISRKMKEKVWSLAKERGFQPNLAASQLRTGKGRVIGVIVPRIGRSFFSLLIESIENVVNEAGYSVLVAQSHELWEKEKQVLQAMMQKVDGLAISLAADTIDYQHFDQAIEKGMPIVFFDRIPLFRHVNSVRIDDYAGAYDAVKHMIDRGCKRIAHLAGPQGISVYQQRQMGYVQALKEAGIPISEQLVYQCGITLEAGTKAAEQILSLPLDERPDAVFSSSDNSAMGLFKSLKNNNIKIPEDIAVVGFGNELFDEFVDPMLSSVDQRNVEMGIEVAKMLLEQMNLPIADRKVKDIVLKPQLIVRKSSEK